MDYCHICRRPTRDPVRVILRVWCAECAAARLFTLESQLFALRASLILPVPRGPGTLEKLEISTNVKTPQSTTTTQGARRAPRR